VRLCQLAAAALAALALAGCGRRSADPQAYAVVIGVSQANLTEPWRVTMNEEIRAEAAGYPDLRVVFADAADSADRQIRDVRKLLDSGIDLLIVSPVDAAALTPVVDEAYARIPVVLLDRSVEGYGYTLYIGPDNRIVGKQAGQYIAGLLGERGGKVLEIRGRSGSPPVIDRERGFREAISHVPRITIVDTITADWLRDKAEDEVTAWFRSHRDVDVVFAQNDAMAYGAWRAAKTLGRTGIVFVGVDGLPDPRGGIEMVKRGILSATFTCPTGGREAVIYAMDILRREEGIPKKMFLRTSLVTNETLAAGEVAPAPRGPGDASRRRIVLGFAQVGKESEWRLANTESIKAAAREAGIELVFVDGEQRQENQVRAIREFIARKVDIIAFSPNVESGWRPVLLEAKAAGIPVILTDRAVDEKDETLWVTLMGSDFVEEGRRAARWLVEHLDTTDPVNIVELQGTVGSAPAIDRKAGFEEVLAEHPNYRIIRSVSGDFFRSIGETVMREILVDLRASGEHMDVLFAHNDDMAIGAIAAMEEMGIAPGRDVVIVSVDAIRDAFKAMIDGTLNCTVECSPLLGKQLMKAVKDYMAGKDLPIRMVTAEEVFPAAVARKVLPTRKY
jgi:simple sugar transport system substrate-binding protein